MKTIRLPRFAVLAIALLLTTACGSVPVPPTSTPFPPTHTPEPIAAPTGLPTATVTTAPTNSASEIVSALASLNFVEKGYDEEFHCRTYGDGSMSVLLYDSGGVTLKFVTSTLFPPDMSWTGHSLYKVLHGAYGEDMANAVANHVYASIEQKQVGVFAQYKVEMWIKTNPPSTDATYYTHVTQLGFNELADLNAPVFSSSQLISILTNDGYTLSDYECTAEPCKLYKSEYLWVFVYDSGYVQYQIGLRTPFDGQGNGLNAIRIFLTDNYGLDLSDALIGYIPAAIESNQSGRVGNYAIFMQVDPAHDDTNAQLYIIMTPLNFTSDN